MTQLPVDMNDNPIPALRLKDGGAHMLNSGGSSARNATAFDADTRVVSVYASEDVYLNFGDSNVVASASDHFFPAGVYYDIALGGDGTGHATHLAVLQVSAGGAVYVSEKA